MITEELEGKVVILSGGFNKTAPTVAETFAREGCKLILVDLKNEHEDESGRALIKKLREQGIEVVSIAADLSKPEDIERMCQTALEAFGQVDIIVNLAGPFNVEPWQVLTPETYDRIMNVNVRAIYLLAKGLSAQMKLQGWGKIINFSAGSAYTKNHNVYSLAKMGVQHITESLALELGPEITVNAVCPGQLEESAAVAIKRDPTAVDKYIAKAPLKKLVNRQDVANLLVLMCTHYFDLVTGMTIRIDGGAEIGQF